MTATTAEMAMPKQQSQLKEIATKFVEARQAGVALSGYPGPIPSTFEQAYSIQECAISQWNDVVAGWKIGLVSANQAELLGANRLSGPVFSQSIWPADGDVRFAAIEGGFCAVEAEFVVRVARDAPADKVEWSLDEAAEMIGALHTAVEIAGSPLASINSLGAPVTASDFGNNSGLILGPPVDDWRMRLSSIGCSMMIDGEVVGTGTAMSVPGGPVAALAFLLSHLARRNRPLQAGQYVTTGAMTGVHNILGGQQCIADFGEDGAIVCSAFYR